MFYSAPTIFSGMISLFSASIFFKQSSKFSNFSDLVSGGLYQALIKKGLDFGLEISTVIASDVRPLGHAFPDNLLHFLYK